MSFAKWMSLQIWDPQRCPSLAIKGSLSAQCKGKSRTTQQCLWNCQSTSLTGSSKHLCQHEDTQSYTFLYNSAVKLLITADDVRFPPSLNISFQSFFLNHLLLLFTIADYLDQESNAIGKDSEGLIYTIQSQMPMMLYDIVHDVQKILRLILKVAGSLTYFGKCRGVQTAEK